jgi:hypothetical protein
MDAPHVVMLVVGAAFVALAGLTRSRASAGKWGGTDGQERFVIVGLPCLGVALVLFGLLALLPDAVGGLLALVAVLLCLVALVGGVFGLPLPRWAVPGHLRAERAGRLATESKRRRARKDARRD